MTLAALDGAPLDPGLLRGKVVLVVNVASFCGYTPQYSELQAVYERYRERGLVVLGVPCNQFGEQEPGSNTEIRNFCSTRYAVTFPMLQKQDVNGPGRSPLYGYLVDHAPRPGRDIGWNFEKFLVGRDGRVLARFTSQTTPLDPTVIAAIELALGKPG
ncbi:MAG TPA: glutathione peroxidase [Myxococcota bacterium]|nr:glutathione peroxidase [Myxococcota bacterium]